MPGKGKPPEKQVNGLGMDDIVFRKVQPSRWSDLEALFESPGAPSYCWCMAWRAGGKEAARMKPPERKAALRERVRGGEPVGLLAYLEGEPVAWCSIAPRSTYRPLGGLDVPGEDEASVWSLACFFVKRPLRGQGLGRRLLAAAIDLARAGGAKLVEAYPVDPDSPSYRFMGFVPLFEAAGFREVKRAGSRRHVMRLAL